MYQPLTVHVLFLITHFTVPFRHNVRSQVLFANTLFKAVCYRQDESQVITGGTDRKVAYWETYDGSQIRELDGSESGGINGMDVYGEMFATGSSDKLVKLWLYEKGCVTHKGTYMYNY